MSALEERALRHALGRRFVTSEVVERARGEAAAAGAALLPWLRDRYLTPAQTAELERVCRQAASEGASGSGRSPPAAPSGPRRIGAYELVGELARGGMGLVYRARHAQLGHEVALKVLLAGEGATPAQRERFLLEARAAARIRHPVVVTIHDVGQDGATPYLVMDLVDGESLAHRLARQGPLDPRPAAELGLALAQALAAAHEHLILHRDLKPANVLLDRGGQARLADFGLAKVLDPARSAPRGPTVSGQVVGTPAYMSPEQAGGQAVDVRADVYGLGALLYECLTGEAPFEGATVLEVLARVATEPPVAPRRRRPRDLPPVDRDLETIVLRCLEKDPAQRYPTALELAADLERFLRHEPIAARRPGLAGRLARWSRRNPALARVAAASAGALVVLGIGAASWAEAARRATRAALVDEARAAAAAAMGELAVVGRAATADERTAAALDALQTAQRWHVLDPGDGAAARAHHAAAMALGEVALASEQWALAARAFAQAEATGVDAAAAQGRRQAVDRARSAEAERRAAEVRALLARAEAGELGREREGVLEAAFQVVRYADPQTVGLLGRALDGVSETLERGEAPSRGQEDVARLACAALGRSGIAEGAVPALTRYLAAETDQLRAAVAGEALVRLGGAAALEAVHEARRRFGINDVFARRVRRLLGVGASGGAADPESSSADGVIALLERADELHVEGDLEAARDAFSRALELDPTVVEAWNDRGLVRKALGELEGAFADLSRAIEVDPSFATSWTNRALVRQARGDLAGALTDLDRSLELDPSAARSWFDRATVRHALGDHEGALLDYTRSLELDPAYAQAWVNRSVLRSEVGDRDGALSDATRALEVDPTESIAWGARASLRAEQGDLEGALADYSRAIDLEPTRSGLWTNRARSRWRAGDLEGAFADYSRALELDPESAHAWAGRAGLRQVQGDLAGAAADFTRSLELDPTRATIWTNRGVVRYLQGELAGALSDYSRAIELDPLYPNPWGARGELREELGDAAGARSDLARFVELAPADDPAIPRVRAKLERLAADGAR